MPNEKNAKAPKLSLCEEIIKYVDKNKESMKLLNILIAMEENNIVNSDHLDHLIESLGKNEIETSVQIISQTLPLDEIQKYFKIGNIYGKSNCFHDLSKIARIVEYGCQNAE